MTEQEFLTAAKERFGSRGLRQAKTMLEELDKKKPSVPADEIPAHRSLMMDLWLDSKEEARRKFTPKKYRLL